MKYIFARVLFSSLAFVLGVSCSAVMNPSHSPDRSVFRRISRMLYRAPKRFESFSVGCGKGFHVYKYRVDDGQTVEESGATFSTKGEADIYFKKMIARGGRIIERVPEFQNEFGKTGERFVLAESDGADGDGGVRIVWYDGRESIRTINAATEELALEFEQYLFDEMAESNYPKQN